MQSTPHIAIDEELSMWPLQPGEAPKLAALLNEPTVAENTLNIPYPYSLEDAKMWVDNVQRKGARFGAQFDLAIRRYGVVIGGIGFHLKHGLNAHSDEIGYWLGKDYRGQGIATKAIAAFCRWGFQQRPSLVRIEAPVFKRNPASQRALKKAGFQYEGTLRKVYHKNGEYLDGMVYALLREDLS